MENELIVKNTDGSYYPILFADDFSGLSDALISTGLHPDGICLTADTNTAPLYLEKVQKEITPLTPKVKKFIFHAGEKYKNAESLSALLTALVEAGFTRKSLIISVGGGVVSDMTGFAAAIYMRGIAFAEIPTTLLSQTDASIGGKTGIDFLQYKNMIGAFHMPSFVYITTDTLASLPDREYSGGLAEILKAGLIKDENFYGWLLEHMDEINEKDPKTVRRMIQKACRIKQQVVENDPKEAGERMLLNFGHTIGHAVEKALHFSKTHGECVCLGSLAAMKISFDRGYIGEDELLEFRDSCVGFGLPIFADGIDKQEVLEFTKADKKIRDGHIHFILLRHIGEGIIKTDVTDEELLTGIEFIKGDID